MTSETAIYRGYVRTNRGTYLVQLPDDSTFGFSLLSDDQSWPGGFGIAIAWEAVSADDVPADVRERLGFLLDR